MQIVGNVRKQNSWGVLFVDMRLEQVLRGVASFAEQLKEVLCGGVDSCNSS